MNLTHVHIKKLEILTTGVLLHFITHQHKQMKAGSCNYNSADMMKQGVYKSSLTNFQDTSNNFSSRYFYTDRASLVLQLYAQKLAQT